MLAREAHEARHKRWKRWVGRGTVRSFTPGPGYGSHFIPRVDQERLVGFIGHDLDQLAVRRSPWPPPAGPASRWNTGSSP